MNKFLERAKIVACFVLACIIFIVLFYGVIHVIAYLKIETNAVLAVSMVIGSGLAYYNIKTNQKIARQRAMLDFVNAYNEDDMVSKGHKIIRDQKEPIKDYLEKGENREHFLSLMNRFEILAVGLDAGIYDPKMAVNIFGTEVHDILTRAKPMVNYIRENEDEDIFSNMEKMTDRYFS